MGSKRGSGRVSGPSKGANTDEGTTGDVQPRRSGRNSAPTAVECTKKKAVKTNSKMAASCQKKGLSGRSTRPISKVKAPNKSAPSQNHAPSLRKRTRQSLKEASDHEEEEKEEGERRVRELCR